MSRIDPPLQGSHAALAVPADACGGRPPGAAGRGSHFCHESLFYSGPDEFLAGTLPLIDRTLERQGPVLVAAREANLELLREALGERAGGVRLADMRVLGRNPARIISAWHQFLGAAASRGAPALGIGEPIWPGRSAAELTECQRHESLLNLAFAGGPPWRLLCPYDLDGLDEAVIEAARRSHPFVVADGARERSGLFRDDGHEGTFDGELPPPPRSVPRTSFSRERVRMVRRVVARQAEEARLDLERSQRLVLAVSELASNSVRHGGGTGTFRVWRENGTLLCEVQDAGRIEAPLAGRIKPPPNQLTGRGLWLVNELCDLVQIRSDDTGTVVRVHMDLIARSESATWRAPPR
jgi:anti-sigma regulatory factor (Ser/Thr protein kinase)